MILSIVDLHALTIPTAQKTSTLNANCYKMATTIIGCGIDIDRTLLYYQSCVPQHAELMWLLSCHSSIGYLQRMPQFNKKSTTENASAGILTYPVLQSADILLFQTTHVPVGHDQLIHLNFTRDLVDRINAFYDCQLFVKPDVCISDAPKIQSLRNPNKKMSKSEASHMARIDLTDSCDEIIKKIKKSVSDSQGKTLTFDEDNRKGLANLIRIFTVIRREREQNSELTMDDTVKLFEHCTTEQFKLECGDYIASYFKPMREEILRLRKEKKYIQQLMQRNASECREMAEETVARTKKVFGLPH